MGGGNPLSSLTLVLCSGLLSGSRRGRLETDSKELQADVLFVDGHVVGRLMLGSKKKFSRFRLSGLRGPRTLFESFLPRCLSRSVNDIIVFGDKRGEMRMKNAFGSSDLDKCDEEEQLGLKESKVDGRRGLTMGGLTSTTMSVDKSPLYVASYSPPPFLHQ